MKDLEEKKIEAKKLIEDMFDNAVSEIGAELKSSKKKTKKSSPKN